MTPSAEQIGEGRLWATINASALLRQSFEGAMERCVEEAETGSQIFLEHRNDIGKPTQIGTCTRLAVQVEKIIEEWEESKGSVLPVPHSDLTNASKPVNGKVSLPSERNLYVAMNRLRLVRMTLPEVLRQHRPNIERAKKAGLERIDFTVSAIAKDRQVKRRVEDYWEPRHSYHDNSFSQRRRWFS